jgi:hypothetical protein
MLYKELLVYNKKGAKRDNRTAAAAAHVCKHKLQFPLLPVIIIIIRQPQQQQQQQRLLLKFEGKRLMRRKKTLHTRMMRKPIGLQRVLL